MISSKSLRAALVAAATLVAAASASQAQTPLTAYEDAKGYLNVRALPAPSSPVRPRMTPTSLEPGTAAGGTAM